VDKIIAQATTLNTITSEFGGVTCPGGLLDRLRLMENRFDEVFGPPGSDSQLSPFKQKDTLDRLEVLESAVAQQRRNLQAMQHDNDTVRTLNGPMHAPPVMHGHLRTPTCVGGALSRSGTDVSMCRE
jgi:hypothetical protein